MSVTAVLAAAVTLALLLPGPRPVSDWGPSHPGAPRQRQRLGPGLTVVAAGVMAVLLVSVQGRHLALSAIVLGVVCGAGLLARRSRSARVAERRQALVVEVCEALVGELRAGQPLAASLEHCVEVWPEFEPIVAANRLGADVPTALRRLAGQPGASGLSEVAAAWQIAQASGAGLATALSQVAATARERQATRHLVQGELSSAQATARLVAGLPVVSLAMSAGIGGHPWHFLLGTAGGLVCLGAGVGFAFAGLLWIDRIAAAVLRG